MGTYNYIMGIPIPEDQKDKYDNVVKVGNKYYVKLGTTYNTQVQAKVGDLLTIGVAEIKATDTKGKIKITWDNPVVRDNPKTTGFIRKPDPISEILTLAKYHRSFSPIGMQKELTNEGTTSNQIEGQLDFTEGMRGVGIIQIHTLGLKEDEAKNFELDKGSSHIDIRMKPNNAEYWEGGEFMIGNAKFFAKKFRGLKKGEKLLFNFKVPRVDERTKNQKVSIIKGPDVWLKMGVDKPAIFPPGSVGALSNTYATMIALEKFEWVADKQIDVNGKPHFKVFTYKPTWLNKEWLSKLGWNVEKDGAPLEGTIEFTYAPIDGGRHWLAFGGKQEMKDFFVKDEVKKEVTGIVYEPDTFDAEGDWMTEDDIEEAERSFMLNSGKIYFHHQKEIAAKVVESWIAPTDINIQKDDGSTETIKKGTWLMTVKVFDDEMWKKIEDGTIKGFSMSGYAIEEEE